MYTKITEAYYGLLWFIVFLRCFTIEHEILLIKEGFSERNMKFMVQLCKEYRLGDEIGKQPVSQLPNLQQLVAKMPWGHNILLIRRMLQLVSPFVKGGLRGI